MPRLKLELVNPSVFFSKIPFGSPSGSGFGRSIFLEALQHSVSFGCCEFAKRSHGPNYTALGDFLTPLLALDPGGGESLTDGEHLVVPNWLIGWTGALSGYFRWANVKKCVGHNDEDTVTDCRVTAR
jgi:hypothetical protein